MDFRFYLSRFLRQFHWFLLVVILVSAAGVAAARLMPTVFVAKALLVVESEQIPDAMAQSTVQTQATEQLQIIEQRILTRENLLEMANRLKVYAGQTASGDRPMTAGDIVTDMRSRVEITTTSDNGQGGRGVQATLVTVGFEAPTAQMAAAVANEMVTLILEEDVAMRTIVARQTLEFFEQEVDRLEQELAERSAAILTFKEANIAALPDSLEFRREDLATVEARLTEVERARSVLLDQIDRLTRMRGTASSVEGDDAQVGNDGTSRQVTTRDIRREDLEGELAFLDEEQAKLEARAAELQADIAKTPGNAIVLETLERDYENVRSQYDQAIGNRAKAQTGETIEALAKGQRISVIEQAVAPDEPARPNRPKIAAAGVGAGFGLGIALVVLIEFLRGAIRRPADLTDALGIAPFATLPYVATRREVLWTRVLVWGGLLALIAAGAAGLWVVHTQVMPLDMVWDKVMDRLPLWARF